MYENYKDKHPINFRRQSMEPRHFKSEYCQPNYYEGACWVPSLYAAPGSKEYHNALVAAEYTGWRDESLATHLTCGISTSLNPLKLLRVSGKDATAFLKRNMVNNFDKFPIDTTKHGIVVRENGNIAATGVLMRTGEDCYELFAFIPIMFARYAQQKADYQDLKLEDISDTRFAFQLMGPKSLEILEQASQTDLHDLTFKAKSPRLPGLFQRYMRVSGSSAISFIPVCAPFSPRFLLRLKQPAPYPVYTSRVDSNIILLYSATFCLSKHAPPSSVTLPPSAMDPAQLCRVLLFHVFTFLFQRRLQNVKDAFCR